MNVLRIGSLLVLAIVLFMASSAVAQNSTDPTLYCSVFSLQPYSVVVGPAPDPDHLGASLAPVVQTTYGVTEYFITLSQQITNNNLFLDLNNSGNGNVTFSVQWGLVNPATNEIINPQWIIDSTTGLAEIFYFNNSGWQVDLTPFTSGGSLSRTYLVIVNLTENVYGPTGLNGAIGRVDGCYYTDYFFITNPANNSNNTSGFGGGSSSSTGGSAVVGDPLFIGLRGQHYQIHGIDGAVYNLISDASLQLNSRFRFLHGPRKCPVMPSTGQQSKACWSHVGSYLSELALRTNAQDRLLIVAGDADIGFASVSLNGQAMKVDGFAVLKNHMGDVAFNSTHEVTFTAGHFRITVENIDGFLNLRSVSVDDFAAVSSHGLLGQTWSTKKYSGKIKEIEGDVDDYVVLSDNIFGNDFLFNRFQVADA